MYAPVADFAPHRGPDRYRRWNDLHLRGNAAALTAPNDVVIGPDVATTLANLASAINATPAGAGIAYATGTAANTSVTATGSTATALTLQAIQSGSVGNSIATSTNWTGGSFGAGDLTGGTDAGTFSDSIMVYDSLGNSHVLTFNFTKSSAGEWNYQITIPAADVGATGNPQVVATGTLQFGPDGNLISPAADVQGITVSGLADGAKTMSLNWQLFSSPGTPSLPRRQNLLPPPGKDQDGYSAGTLQSYTIESSGVIDGVLSNGQTVALGQIALATFPNYNGLTNLGSNDYQASLASGAASVRDTGKRRPWNSGRKLAGGIQRGHRHGLHRAHPGRTWIRGQCQGHHDGRQCDAGLHRLDTGLSLHK